MRSINATTFNDLEWSEPRMSQGHAMMLSISETVQYKDTGLVTMED